MPETEMQSRPREEPRKRSWSKSLVNFWLDIALLFSFVVLIVASAVLQFVFPLATQATGWTVWGGDYNDWHAFEFGALCVFTGGIIVHVMLHWTWICGVITRKILRVPNDTTDGTRTLFGVGVLIGLLHVIGGIVAAAYLTVRAPGM